MISSFSDTYNLINSIIEEYPLLRGARILYITGVQLG